MKDNIILFEFSAKNKENYVDDYYVKSSNTVITASKNKMNKLMKSNAAIIENITAYKIAQEAKNGQMQDMIIKNIIEALETDGINLCEFTNYWSIKDVSYSIYRNTLITEKQKMDFLKHIIPQYIENRHSLYNIHGYSFTTLQVVSDSKAHKKSADIGIIKVSDILQSFKLTYFTSDDIAKFNDTDNIYIYPDKTETILFLRILEHNNIKFEWSKNHENKRPDFLFKKDNNIFIMEHKHLKEAGGGQDKQMTEIINFISYKDKDVSYISFLDGIYFNILTDESITAGKPFEQRRSIINKLKSNKQNYFVNTIGFIELMKSM